jgi:outer membrane protein assembly factor BamB
MVSPWPKFQQNNANNGRADSWLTSDSIQVSEWSFPTTSSIYSTPAISDSGAVTFSSSNGNVYSLSSTGNLIWNYSYQLNASILKKNPTSSCSVASDSSPTLDEYG